MPDKKLTDNEYKMYTPNECLQKIVDLHKEINRLQARVEKCEKVEHFADKTIATLQAENEKLYQINFDLCNAGGRLLHQKDTIKAEAYKEFAEKAIEKVEKARQKYQRLCKEQGEEIDEAMNIHFNGMINLLKELVGEDNGG